MSAQPRCAAAGRRLVRSSSDDSRLYSVDRPDPVPDRRAAALVAQLELGLLPERRAGHRRRHRRRPVVHGTDLATTEHKSAHPNEIAMTMKTTMLALTLLALLGAAPLIGACHTTAG